MARMARGAFEQRSPHSDRITPLLFKTAVILAVAAALYAVSYGVPLSGLPETKEMERLHIIFVPTNETRIFDVTEDITLAEDIKLALEAAELLKNEGIDAAVINMASIKPLDNDLVRKYAAQCRAIVTTEEHSIIGGLGSAVCELICEQGNCPVVRHGVEDRFGKSGPAPALLDLFELNAEGIAEKARYAVSLKK